MQIDTVVIKRLSELKELMNQVDRGKGQNEYGFPIYEEMLLQKWATSVLNILQRVFGEESIHYKNFSSYYRNATGSFEHLQGIFLAAIDDYENGYLFNVRSLVKAEVITDDVIRQAEELLGAGYKDPACVLAGVALETTLKELCTQRCIPTGKLDRMNTDLARVGLYNLAKQKQITAWADLRNKAAHGQWAEYIKPMSRLLLMV